MPQTLLSAQTLIFFSVHPKQTLEDSDANLLTLSKQMLIKMKQIAMRQTLLFHDAADEAVTDAFIDGAEAVTDAHLADATIQADVDANELLQANAIAAVCG